MSFFEPPPPPPEPEHPRQPLWLGPRENELGVPVPLAVVLARTNDVAVAVLGLTAFSTGFEIHATLRTREQLDNFHEVLMMNRPTRHRAELEPELFRFGVEFSDGRKATNLGHPFHKEQQDESPGEPVLMPRSGGGGGKSWEMNWWVWPLPPPGALALVCEWPAHGIELTRYELDGATVIDAASTVETLWPENDGPSGGRASSLAVT